MTKDGEKMKKIALTGIKPTGTPHIGNYLGAIKPALELSENYDARYFIADYHALNSIKDPNLLNELTYEIAATWLAFGLDTKKVLFYRQSDIPEIFELSIFLSAFTAKGLMNRAHAYKAVVAVNKENSKEDDHNINMGLFTYPILMAADILMFNTNLVPVGKDQKQHIEIAADIAQAINYNYKKEVLTIPEPLINENTPLIPGLDGRKMSKSYNNVISPFLPTKKLRKLIMKIKTNSQGIEEVKNPDECNVFALYKLFASQIEQEALRKRYLAGGMGWGNAKQTLFEKMEEVFAPYRDNYNTIINDKAEIDRQLKDGALKAREISSKTMQRLRKTAGL
jgi:tryptophanyl-tRNA synthetase